MSNYSCGRCLFTINQEKLVTMLNGGIAECPKCGSPLYLDDTWFLKSPEAVVFAFKDQYNGIKLGHLAFGHYDRVFFEDQLHAINKKDDSE